MNKNNLIYSVYLDVPMMTSFLASMQGGIIEESFIQNSNTNNEKEKGSIKAQIGAQILSFFKTSADGEISNEVENKIESNYKTNVKYPQSLLFSNLKKLLDENGLITKINNISIIQGLEIGDIVELSGIIKPEPSITIRNAFNQLLPLIEPTFALQLNQFEQLKEIVKNVNQKNTFTTSDGTVIDNSNKSQYIKNIDLKINEQKVNQNLLSTIKETINVLFPYQSKFQRIVVQCLEVPIVCNVYPEYSRNSSIEEIHFSEWKIIGKIIYKISKDKPFDLLKDSPFGLLHKSFFAELVKSLNNDEIKIPVVDNIINVDSLVIAPIAIYC